MTDKKLKAAIYARVSSTDQNPEAQLTELREYANKRGFEIYREYVDYVTGDFKKRKRSKKQKGQAYLDLMEDARKRKIDCVLVWKYDRFARSLSVLITDLEEFNNLGVDFISYTQNIDTTTPIGRLFYNVIGSFAEFERETIVERVKAGLANAKAKGIQLGRPVKDETAPERILALRQEGLSLRQIGKIEGLTAPGVLKILRRIDPVIVADDQKADLTHVPASKSAKEIASFMLSADAIESAVLSANRPEIYQLKLDILGVEPQIWRHLLIKGEMTLKKLSDAICNTFSWSGYADYYFAFMEKERGVGIRLPVNSESVSDFALSPSEKLLYMYKCGNETDWAVLITVEKFLLLDQSLQYPHCAAGQLAGPPEKCGGPDAYQRAYYYLSRQKSRAIETPVSKISRLEKDWYREHYRFFDPDEFDIDETNRRLLRRRLRLYRTDE